MRLAVLTPTPARSVRAPGLVRAYRRKAHPNQPRAVFKPGSNRTPLPAEQRPDAEGAATAKKYRKIPVCVSFGFVGSGFHGLQSQPMRPDLPTVAATLRQALLKSGAIAESNFEPLSRTKWSLSSRTDKGVHAAGAAASFRMETLPEQLEQLDDGRVALSAAEVERINGLLPPAVRVFGALKVRKGFDARLCASSREYEYLLPLAALGGSSTEE